MAGEQGAPNPAGDKRRWTEQFEVAIEDLQKRVQELVAEGNVRRLIIRHEGRTILDIPLTVAVVGGAAGMLFGWWLMALMAIAGIAARVQVIIEREGEPPAEGPGAGI